MTNIVKVKESKFGKLLEVPEELLTKKYLKECKDGEADQIPINRAKLKTKKGKYLIITNDEKEIHTKKRSDYKKTCYLSLKKKKELNKQKNLNKNKEKYTKKFQKKSFLNTIKSSVASAKNYVTGEKTKIPEELNNYIKNLEKINGLLKHTYHIDEQTTIVLLKHLKLKLHPEFNNTDEQKKYLQTVFTNAKIKELKYKIKVSYLFDLLSEQNININAIKIQLGELDKYKLYSEDIYDKLLKNFIDLVICFLSSNSFIINSFSNITSLIIQLNDFIINSKFEASENTKNKDQIEKKRKAESIKLMVIRDQIQIQRNTIFTESNVYNNIDRIYDRIYDVLSKLISEIMPYREYKEISSNLIRNDGINNIFDDEIGKTLNEKQFAKIFTIVKSDKTNIIDALVESNYFYSKDLNIVNLHDRLSDIMITVFETDEYEEIITSLNEDKTYKDKIKLFLNIFEDKVQRGSNYGTYESFNKTLETWRERTDIQELDSICTKIDRNILLYIQNVKENIIPIKSINYSREISLNFSPIFFGKFKRPEDYSFSKKNILQICINNNEPCRIDTEKLIIFISLYLRNFKRNNDLFKFNIRLNEETKKKQLDIINKQINDFITPRGITYGAKSNFNLENYINGMGFNRFLDLNELLLTQKIFIALVANNNISNNEKKLIFFVLEDLFNLKIFIFKKNKTTTQTYYEINADTLLKSNYDDQSVLPSKTEFNYIILAESLIETNKKLIYNILQYKSKKYFEWDEIPSDIKQLIVNNTDSKLLIAD